MWNKTPNSSSNASLILELTVPSAAWPVASLPWGHATSEVSRSGQAARELGAPGMESDQDLTSAAPNDR